MRHRRISHGGIIILLLGSSLFWGCIEWGPFPSTFRCQSSLHEGKYDEAIKACSQEIASYPNSDDRYNIRGIAYSSKGNIDAAIADYSKAINLDPKKSAYYHNRGDAFYRKKIFDQAISDFDRAIVLDPTSIDVYMMRGYCYFEKGQFEKALSDFQTVLKGNPDYPNLDEWLGRSCYYLGRYDDAVQAFESGSQKSGGENLGPWLKKAKAAKALGMEVSRGESGIKVDKVMKGGGADLGGIMVGDILIEFHGEKLAALDLNQFMNIAAEKPRYDSKVKVKVLRNGSTLEKNIVMGMPSNLSPPAQRTQGPAHESQGAPVQRGDAGLSPPALEKYAAKNLPKIAVWDLMPREVKSTYAQELTSILVSEITRLKKYEVYSQENVRTLAGWTAERMKLGCTSTQCLTALGQMDISKLISGSVGKIGMRYTVSLNLFDTQNTRAENSISEFCQSEDELIELIQRAVLKLLKSDH
jgi:Tfp pilus assembly protein PilF